MKKLYFFVILLMIGSLSIQAQNNPEPWQTGHWLSAEEMLRKNEVGKNFVETDPPLGPVRNFAEYDRMQGALVRYPFGIPLTLVKEMSEDVMVTTIVASEAQKNTVISQYQSAGVNMANTDFLIAPSDSYWTRDYGPWFASDSSHQIGIIDFPYNRPRPNDDEIPKKIANMLGIPWYGMNLIHTGGNYMTDGFGYSSSTTLVYVENPALTEDQVAQKVHDYLGIENYMVREDPNGTYIDHIDCWGKFLAPDKILIRKVPPSDPQYDTVEQTAAWYASHPCSYGYNYKVYRVYTPNGQPYTNSVILNNKVLVPIMNSSWDDTAIAAYQAAMPGYEIIGFVGNPSTPWQATDALHCRVMGIADLGQLFLHHIPLAGNQPAQDNFHLTADLIRYSDSTAWEDSVLVYYKVNNGNYNILHMTKVSGDNYSAYIPKQSPGSVIQYYLYAADKSGHHAMSPIMGPADPYTFTAVYTDLTAIPDTLWFETYDDAYNGKTTRIHNFTQGTINLISMDQYGLCANGVWTVSPFVTYPHMMSAGDSLEVTVRFAVGKSMGSLGYFIDTLNYVSAIGAHRIILMVNDSLDLRLGVNEKNNNFTFLNYPNPFRGSTTFSFTLEKREHVKITLFSSMGKEVALISENEFEKGDHKVQFQADNLPAGVYFAELRTKTGRMVHQVLICNY